MTLKSYKVCSIGTSQAEIKRRATAKIKPSLSPKEKLDFLFSRAHQNILDAQTDVMRAGSYMSGLKKILAMEITDEEKCGLTKELRKARKDSYQDINILFKFVASF